MSAAGPRVLEKLDKAPIVEVVAGILFEPIAELDPIVVGKFWHENRADFPRHEIRPVVADPPAAPAAAAVFEMSARAPVGPLRTMLFSEDRTALVQMQHDRFYVNWKRADPDTVDGARAGQYPRFSDDAGPGLVTTVLKQFERFSDFCQRELGSRPKVLQLELAKVDLLIEGLDWNGLADVAELLPWLRTFVAFADSDDPSFAVRFDERRSDGNLSVSIARGQLQASQGPRRMVKLETRVRKALAGIEMREGFLLANSDLNRVFAQLIPLDQRQRFQGAV